MAPDGPQNQSRLRSLLTKGPSRPDARQGKEILKGLLKGQSASNNTESNFLLKVRQCSWSGAGFSTQL